MRLHEVVDELIKAPCPWTASVTARGMLRFLRSECDEVLEAIEDVEAAAATSDCSSSCTSSSSSSPSLQALGRRHLLSELGDVLFDAYMLHGICRRDFGLDGDDHTAWDMAAEKARNRTCV